MKALQATLIGLGLSDDLRRHLRDGDARRRQDASRRTRGMTATGIADDLTWNRMLTPIGPGSRGHAGPGPPARTHREAPRARCRWTASTAPSTKAAVVAFQKHMGLTANGIAGLQTWRWLLWHYETAGLQRDDPVRLHRGQRRRRTGRPVRRSVQLEATAATVAAAGYGRIAVGDAGLEHGGNIPGHLTHEVGLDIDIRLIRKDREPVPLRARTTTSRPTTGPRPEP